LSDVLTPDYLKSGIFLQESPTLELWEFSARHSFYEMEQYCRRDPNVALQIDSIISDPSKGVEYLLNRHLAVPFVSGVVSDFFTRRAQDVAWLRHCLTPTETYRPTPTAFGAFGGVHSEHMNDEVRKGRFNYASDRRVDCVICLNKAQGLDEIHERSRPNTPTPPPNF